MKLALAAALVLAAGAEKTASGQAGTVCALVKLEILQQATLEREAFDAHLTLTNNLQTSSLQNIRVDVFIKDSNGNPANQLFFIRPDTTTMTNINAVDGTGTIQPGAAASIHWLIIPSTGAGGVVPAGQLYNVDAAITYLGGGITQTLTTFDAQITVLPQPSLKLEYALPFEVFGQEPLLNTPTPIIPFPVGLRVTNIGYGTAQNLQITSGQPQIVDNKQGLLVDFKLIGSFVSTGPVTNSLNLPFGNVQPNKPELGSWLMTSSLSGRFVSFTASFTHSDALGGALTSLIQSVTTYTLIKDVLVDLPGRDKQFDLLVNASTPRTQIDLNLTTNNQEPTPEMILESDQPTPILVTNEPSIASGTLSGVNASLTVILTQLNAQPTWVHTSMPDPANGQAVLQSVTRQDGKILDPHNAWISKHFDRNNLVYRYFLHILDYDTVVNTQTQYFVNYSAKQLATPPAAVVDLNAVPAASTGALSLSWTSPGENGSTGTIAGGEYLIEREELSTASFSTTTAQVGFATTTVALAAQAYQLSSLPGNTTEYVRLWTVDGAGLLSPISNGATSYVLPIPPGLNGSVTLSTNTLSFSWTPGNNRAPVVYDLFLSTSASTPQVAQFAGLDGSSTTLTFASLAPGALYTLTAQARNPSTGVTSPVATLFSGSTLVNPPLASAFVGVTTNSVTAQWLLNGDPASTEFFAELSTSPTRTPILASSGWIRASSFTFTGLQTLTLYYGQVKARNAAQVVTSYTDLGPIRTQAAGPPAITDLAAATGSSRDGDVSLSWTSTGGQAEFVVRSATNPIVFFDTPPTPYSDALFASTAPAGTPLTYTVSGLSPGTSYFFAIEGADATGQRGVWQSSSPVAAALDLPPPPPFGVATQNIGVDHVTIVWSTPTVNGTNDLDLYRVYRGTYPFFTVDQAKRVIYPDAVQPGTSLTYYRQGLSPNTTYFWRVAAIDQGDSTGQTFHYWSVSSATANGYSYSFNQVFRTTFVFTALYYPDAIYLNPSAPGGSAIVYYNGASTSTIYSGSNYGSYTVQEVAGPPAPGLYSQALQSVLSAAASDVTLAAVPSTAPVSFASVGFTSATVQWLADGNPPATQYDVQASTALDFSGNLVDSGWAPGLSRTLTGLANGTTYYARVKARNWHAVESDYALIGGQMLQGDKLPPRTSLLAGAPSFSASTTTLYATNQTTFSLSAVDDLFVIGDSSGSGVAQTSIAVDTTAFSIYAGTFSFSGEGAHSVSFYSADLAGNVEAAHTVAVDVDLTAPVTQLQVSGSSATDSSGNVAVSSTTALLLAATDPVSNGVASGVADVLYVVDSDPFSPACAAVPLDPTAPSGTCANEAYNGPFTVAPGTHTVYYFSQDNVGNQETVNVTSVTVDASVPSVAFTPSTGTRIDTASPLIAVSYSDPGSGINAASVRVTLDGVDVTTQAVITASSATFQAPSRLPDGPHTVSVSVANGVGGLAQASATFIVDTIAPVTTLVSGSPSFTAGSVFVAPATPLSFTTTQPSRTSYAIDAASFTTYAAPFSIPAPGAHRLRYYSVDLAGNVESVKTSTVAVDVLPTRTSLGAGTPSFASGTLLYADNATTFTLTAVDDLATVGDGAGSGAAASYVAIDTTTFSLYTGTFSLAGEGLHAILYKSVDQLGNAEAVEVSTVAVDLTAPVTQLQVSGPSATDSQGHLAVSSVTAIALSATDPVSNGVASGVADILYVVDQDPFSPACAAVPLDPTQPSGTCANEAYNGAFTLAAGTHTVYYFSQDNVGNQETVNVTSVTVDASAPAVTLSLSSGTRIDTATPAITITYADPGSGVNPASVRVFLDGVDVTTQASITATSATLNVTSALAQGQHTIAVTVANGLGTTSSASSTFVVDTVPPVTTLSAGSPSFTSGSIFVAPTTPLALAANKPARTSYAVDGASFTAYAAPFSIAAAGVHQVRYFSVDVAGNVETVRVSTVAVDVLPPRTTLAEGTPSFSSGTLLYADNATTFTLAAVDDLALVGDAAGSGVAQTLLAVDTTTFSPYTGAFSLASEGLHAVSFKSVDQLGDAEAANNAQIAVDLTPPITLLQVSGPSASDALGNLVVTTMTSISLAATDPVSNGVASGVADTLYVIDQDPFSPSCAGTPLDPTQPSGTCANEAYNGPFTLMPGAHTIYFFSQDHVENQEAVNVTSVTVDASAPTLALSPVAGSTVTTGSPLLAAVYSDPAEGINAASARLSLDGVDVTAQAAITASSATFTPASPLPPGAHTIAATVADKVGNASAASATFFVDTIAPVTTLAIGTPQYGVYIATATPLSFAASKPAQTYYAVDTATFTLFTAKFTINAGGPHSIRYYSVDAYGVTEPIRTSSVTVDVLAPRTSLAEGTPSFSSGTLLYADNATTFTLTAVDDLVVVGDGTGSGVAQTLLAVDTTTFSIYAGTFSLASEGIHTILYKSVDQVGGAETANTAEVAVDLTPPVTLLQVSGANATDGQGNLVISSATLLALSAIDPLSNGVASGVADTLYVIDQDPFSPSCAGTPLDPTQPSGTCANEAYNGPFTLAPGAHTIYFFSQDHVENQETVQVTSVTVDATMPTLALSPVAGSTVTTGAPLLAAVYSDPAEGINAASVHFFLDGVDVTAQAAVSASSATYSASNLAPGAHTITAFAADKVGNSATASATFFVDTVPPATALVIGNPQFGVFIATQTPLSFTVSKPAQTFYAVDAASFTLFAANFTIAAGGAHSIRYYSVDPAGVTEAIKTSSITVDATAPVTQLAVDGSPTSASSIAIVSTDTLSFAATDTGSGVASTSYSLDGAPAQPFASPFTLSAGLHTVAFQSRDNVGNLEAPQSAYVTVASTAAPAAALASITVAPSTAALAIGAMQAFVATGHFGDGSSRILLADGSWTTGTPIPTPRVSYAAGYVNGKLYVIGGEDPVGNDLAAVEAYDPSSNRWTELPPAPVARSLAQTVVYNNKIYVIGGCLIDGCPNTAGQTGRVDIYDPATGAWSTGHAAPIPRYYGVGVLLNGKIYLFAGATSGASTGEVDVYDPVADSWSTAAPMPAPRLWPGVTVLGGKVYVIGGNQDGVGIQSRVDVYDPIANSWTSAAPFLDARWDLAAVTLNGKIHALGGQVNGGPIGSTTHAIYDPAVNAWTPAAPMPNAHGAHMALTDGSRIFVPSGYGLSALTSALDILGIDVTWSSDNAAVASVSAEGVATGVAAGSAHVLASYGTISGQAAITVAPTLVSINVKPAAATLALGATQQFTAVGAYSDGSAQTLSGFGSWSYGPGLPEAIADGSGIFVNGKFYVIGGRNPAATLAYDPAAGTWTTLAAPPVTRDLAGAQAVGNVIYVFGGCLNFDCNSTTGVNWAYDTAANTWTQKASMLTARFTTASGVLNGKIYVAGGLTPPFNEQSVLEAYDPAANTWTTLAPMPFARSQSGGAALGGKLYVVGGTDNGQGQPADARAEMVAYDPISNTWSSRAPLPSRQDGPGLASLNGLLYAFGGANADNVTYSSATWVYDPAANAWSAGQPMLDPQVFPEVAAGNGQLFVAGANGGAVTNFETAAVGAGGVMWSSDAPSVATVGASGLASALAAGSAHVLASAGSVSGSAAVTVFVPDTTPPSLTLSPVAGSTVTSASPALYAVYNDTGTGVNASSVRLSLDGANVTAQAVITASSATYQASSLAPGAHTLAASVADNAGNVASASETFYVDTVSPVTTLVIGAPQYGIYVATATPLSFTVSKPAQTFYAVDAASFTLFAANFTIAAGGAHSIRYYSVDPAGVTEAVKTSSVTVDATAPVTQLAVDGSPTSASSIAIVSTDTLSFAATDAGSGVQATMYSLDGGAVQTSTAPFSLTPGNHALAFQSRDNVGNLEALHNVSASVRVYDVTPPTLSLSPVSGSTATTGSPALYAVYADTGTGVNAASVRLSLDGTDVTAQSVITASSATYQAAGLAPGAHTLAASVADNAGNVANASETFYVDTVSPVTTLVIGAPQYGIYIAAATPLSFTVSKPAQTFYAVDAASFTLYTASFAIAADGTHAIHYYSVDPFGVTEAVKTSSVAVDALAPTTTLLVDGNATLAASIAVVSTDTLSFSATDAGSGVQATLYSIDGGAVQTSTAAFTLAVGTHTLAFQSRDNIGNVESLHNVAASVRPIAPPSVSVATPVNGSTITTASPIITAAYAAASGATIASVHLVLDSIDVTAQSVVTASSASYHASNLAQGGHTISVSVADNFGGTAAAASSFAIDSVPPVTTLDIDGNATSGTSVSALTTDTFTLVAVDSGTGVSSTQYALDGGPMKLYFAPFSLAAGNHTLSFQSADVAGNIEPLRTVSIAVSAPAAAPTVVILSPSGSGFLQEVRGSTVVVLGSVSGQALMSWKLEFAAGQNAAFGFILISSGNVAVASAPLGVWNTANVSGWQTLRLTAINALNQTSSVTQNVYAGDPSLLQEIDNLKLPQGVAVGPSGSIYVADTGNDRVEVYNANGNLLLTVGSGGNGNGNGNSQGNGNQGLSLEAPQGVATDLYGNIYIADTGDKRAYKLSSLGSVMLSIPTQGKPVGIAVDATGYIYVSDAENAQVAKFNAAGSKLLAFSLPGSKPAGIALDASGNLYVADPKGHRVAIFSSTGALVATWSSPIVDRPYGLAVAAGAVVVTDMAKDAILKLDLRGERTFFFGGRESGLGGPRGAALDSNGLLYVAERGKNRVIKIGPPAPGTSPVPVATRLSVLGQDSGFVTTAQGGKLQSANLAALIVPPGSLSDDTDLQISTPAVRLQQEADLEARKMDGDGLVSVSTGVVFGPDTTALQGLVYIVVPYDPIAVASLKLSEVNAKIYWWNPDKQDWQWVPTRVDPTTHLANGQTRHLGLFKVVLRRDGT